MKRIVAGPHHESVIREQLKAKLLLNRAFLENHGNDNDLAIVQIVSLTRQVSGLARLVLQLLDGHE